MEQLSYHDLEWNTVLLQPKQYTLKSGKRVPWGSSSLSREDFCFQPDPHTAVLSMPAGTGKISDAGYDQMVCLSAIIPVCAHLTFRARIHILQYPSPENRNGQEGLGLFLRDTLEPDPRTGYFYSNMAAAGIFSGKPGLLVREGITPDDTEHVRTRFLPSSSSASEKSLDILLDLDCALLTAVIRTENNPVGTATQTAIEKELVTSRDPEWISLGFFTARGCEIRIDLDSVSVACDATPKAMFPMPALYVSPEGTDSGMGTPESRLDLRSAIQRCQPGQEIRLSSGWYSMKEELVISSKNSGSRLLPKTIRTESGPDGAGGSAVLDFGGQNLGFRIEGNHWDISGLTVTAGFGFQIQGSHNRIHHCQAVSNLETGFLIRHRSIDSPVKQWPSHSEISDCVSCFNRDRSEQHADGFACKIAAGYGNAFLRCTAWMNSDDGFDLFSKNRKIGSVRLADCKSWLNGYGFHDGKPVPTRGNGNGFKLGGSGLAADHEAVRCEAFGNRGYGFTSNSNPRMRLFSCDARNNRRNYAFYFSSSSVPPVCLMENCTDRQDPSFDPNIWATRHIPHESIFRGGFEKPNVLIMCSSLYGGGAERVSCRLACGLSARYRVTMLYMQDKGQTYDLEPDIRLLAIPRYEGPFEEVMNRRASYVRLIKELLQPLVSISFMFTMNKLNVKSAGTGRVICSERNNPAKRDPEHLEEIGALYESADHVVFQSEAVRSLFSERVRSHSSIILNPVNVPCQRNGSRHRIVNLARLTPQKNQAMLIRAFAAFYRTHPDYTLSIYGEGELAAALRDLADSLELGDAVQLHGFVRDVHRAVADAEIFALSSDYEGLSNSLLECMMMGFPCISTRCEGSTDLISHRKNGLLVGVGSESQMAGAMTELAENAGLRERLGAEAQNTSAQFRTEQILRKWEQLILQVITGG